jgi:phage terminase large subunit
LDLLPWQGEARRAIHRQDVVEALVSGAYGSGKSLLLCLLAVEEALKPANEVALCRDTYASLRKTTLLSLLKSDGQRPAVLPPGCYNWNKSEASLDVNGGGRIWLIGVRDALSLRSFNLGSVFIDEVTELSEDSYMELLGRIRGQNTDHRFVLSVTNPGGPSHWAHRRFLRQPPPGLWTKTVSSYENPMLPQDYLKELERLTGSRRERCLLGKWVGSEHAVWPEFDRARHVRHEDCASADSWVIGVDYGYADPTSLVVLACNGSKKFHVAEAEERPKMLMGEIVKLCSSYSARSPVIVVDPSAAQLIAELRNAGLTVEKAFNPIDEGVGLVAQLLADGMVSIEPGLTKLCADIESYSRDDSGRVIHEACHGPDALRYALAYARGRSRGAGIWIARAGDRDDELEDEDGEEGWSRIV